MGRIGWKSKEELANKEQSTIEILMAENEKLKKDLDEVRNKHATMQNEQKTLSEDLQGFMDFYFETNTG